MQSPLVYVGIYALTGRDSKEGLIDTLRLLLDNCNQMDDFTRNKTFTSLWRKVSLEFDELH